MLTRIVFSGLLLLATAGMAQDGENSADPGFVEGVFDAETIKEQLDRKNCDGIRFYNAMVDGAVRVMAVSIEKMADVKGGLFQPRPYVVSLGIQNGRIEEEKMSKGNASTACELVEESQYAHYSAHFMKSDLEVLLSKDGCNALKIIPNTKSENLSMEVHAVVFRDGAVTDLGQGTGFDLQCTEPCPPVCGPSGNYVYRPR